MRTGCRGDFVMRMLWVGGWSWDPELARVFGQVRRYHCDCPQNLHLSSKAPTFHSLWFPEDLWVIYEQSPTYLWPIYSLLSWSKVRTILSELLATWVFIVKWHLVCSLCCVQPLSQFTSRMFSPSHVPVNITFSNASLCPSCSLSWWICLF